MKLIRPGLVKFDELSMRFKKTSFRVLQVVLSEIRAKWFH
jgi:hypothetical protein